MIIQLACKKVFGSFVMSNRRTCERQTSPFTYFSWLHTLRLCLFLVTRAAWESSEISIKCVGASRSFPPPLPFFIMRSCVHTLHVIMYPILRNIMNTIDIDHNKDRSEGCMSHILHAKALGL